MLYSLIRPLLFRLDAETAHNVTLGTLRFLNDYGLDTLLNKPIPAQPIEVMGLTFPNPVGLAAGLDKNGDYLDALAALGFGFVEIGTVTPLPQPGNPKPRLFRYPEAEAIINRMGFNNDGVDALVDNIKRSRFQGVLGINIGKNALTPMERAVDDYLTCLNKVYLYASYVTINISSPNTKNLRDLQSSTALSELLGRLKMRQLELAQQHGRYVPLVVKLAPDLEDEAIDDIAKVLLAKEIDGVIATNTTLSRDGVQHIPQAAQDGGLSGAPLKGRSTRVIRRLSDALDGAIPIIGVGGITRGGDAWEKLNAGASLVQIYSGLIFQGPQLIEAAVNACRPYFITHGVTPRRRGPDVQASTLTPGETPAAETPAADAQTPATDAATPTVANPEGAVSSPNEGDASAPPANHGVIQITPGVEPPTVDEPFTEPAPATPVPAPVEPPKKMTLDQMLAAAVAPVVPPRPQPEAPAADAGAEPPPAATVAAAPAEPTADASQAPTIIATTKAANAYMASGPRKKRRPT